MRLRHSQRSFETLKAAGLEAFRARLVQTLPALADRVAEIADWSDVSLLEVRVDRLTRWHRPGLLCIGDAAHAMSPIGGVGINLAIQDAVCAANVLAEALRTGTLTDGLLHEVQARRTFPTKVTQAFQIFAQDRVIDPLLKGAPIVRPPLADAIVRRIPVPAALSGRACSDWERAPSTCGRRTRSPGAAKSAGALASHYTL